MPSVLVDPATGFAYEVYVEAGSTVWAYVFEPYMFTNPATGFNATRLIYWEPWPATFEQELGPGAQAENVFTTFSYTQGCAANPDNNPASPIGASINYWKNVTNPGPQGQTFLFFASVLP
jgi:hypothetical protein